MAQNAGWKTAVFSPENPSPEIWLIRLCEIFTKQSFENGTHNRMSKETMQKAMEWIAKNVFYIMPDSETFALDDVLATARLLLRRFGINLLVIDPWNNLEMQMQKGETENLYVGRMLAKMRMFAMKTGIHIVRRVSVVHSTILNCCLCFVEEITCFHTLTLSLDA